MYRHSLNYWYTIIFTNIRENCVRLTNTTLNIHIKIPLHVQCTSCGEKRFNTSTRVIVLGILYFIRYLLHIIKPTNFAWTSPFWGDCDIRIQQNPQQCLSEELRFRF